GAAAELAAAFDHADREARPREIRRQRQAVVARADHHAIVARHARPPWTLSNHARHGRATISSERISVYARAVAHAPNRRHRDPSVAHWRRPDGADPQGR